MILGWRIPFSAENRDRNRAHWLIASPHPGLAQRLCMPGRILNPILALPPTSAAQCKTCLKLGAPDDPMA